MLWLVSTEFLPENPINTATIKQYNLILKNVVIRTPVSRGIRSPLKVVRGDQLIDPPDHNIPFEMIPLN